MTDTPEFARGLEAAAKWHDERAAWHRKTKHPLDAVLHENYAAIIRALAPRAQGVENTCKYCGVNQHELPWPVCKNEEYRRECQSEDHVGQYRDGE